MTDNMRSNWFFVLLFFMALVLSSCEKDDPGISGNGEIDIETVEYIAPTEDALRVVSDYPAYVIPYDYNNFGKALVDRLQNRVATIDEDNFKDLSTVVLHSSQLEAMEDDWVPVLVQLLRGKNIIIIEPTVDDFNYFCSVITFAYILLCETDEGGVLLDELDIIPGARQTLEAFYEITVESSQLETMFYMNADSNGVFAEAIAVRGCDFHIVDRMSGVAEFEITHEQIDDESGTIEDIETPDIDIASDSDAPGALTPYSYGLFADMLTKWINDCEDYVDNLSKLRSKAADMLNTRATETTKYTLDEITSVQKVQYTMMAATPYDVTNPLPVSVSFEVCSIYMDKEDADYYCIYKKILSYNQLLECGPEEKRTWRTSDNFGEEGLYDMDIYNKEWYPYNFYGPYMRDIQGKSTCETNTENVKGAAGVSVVQYSPKNSIGSVDETNGFSYGFDGGLYLASEPSVNLGFSVSYDRSTTQTIDDLEIIASTANGVPEWKYIGQNLPEAFFNLVLPFSHSEAPTIMRRECEVDQSWIWKVPNPTGSYRLSDETMVSTSIMYYELGFFQANTKYANQSTTKRVNFMMVPPPRSEQLWMMNVSPYSDELNSMLATTHARFWNKDNHEFELYDTSADSRITIEQFITDFERDLNSKRHTWKNRNFKGEFTFSYYNVDDENNEPVSFVFKVE